MLFKLVNVHVSICLKKMGYQGQVLLVDGTPIQTIIDRIAGCKTVAAKYPDIQIVGQQASKNDRASGLAVTTDMLTANPDVRGIFGMNDPSALGAVLAVEHRPEKQNKSSSPVLMAARKLMHGLLNRFFLTFQPRLMPLYGLLVTVQESGLFVSVYFKNQMYNVQKTTFLNFYLQAIMPLVVFTDRFLRLKTAL